MPEGPRKARRRPDVLGAIAACAALGSFSVALILGPGNWLSIAILPAAAGLSGVDLSGPEFAEGHTVALRIASGLTIVGHRAPP